MNKEKIRDRIKKLRSDISFHDDLYYVKSEPVISDYEYDRLYRELKSLEEENPEFSDEDSPTNRVGGRPQESFKTFEHIVRMLSLDNVYEKAELKEWEKRIKKIISGKLFYFVEEKIDGVSISLTYKMGKLATAATRGNGTKGDDITANIRTQRVIPLKLRTDTPPELAEVRGEMFLKKSELKRINIDRANSGQPEFSNTRNTCAGTMKLLDPKEVSKRRLSAFFYGLGAWEGSEKPSSQEELFMRYRDWGLPVDDKSRLCDSLEKALSYCADLEMQRDERDYDIDGAVIKVNEFTKQEVLGETSKSPRWAIAYKFKARGASSVILSVEYNVSRGGKITPVAKIDPVRVGGVVISSVTLHNFDFIDSKNISIGAKVLVERGGDVIPKITKVLETPSTAEPIKIPEYCPSCGSPVKKDIDGVFYRCLNRYCSAKLINRLVHYASIEAMNIEGLGDSVAEQLVYKLSLNSIAAIYDLKYEDLVSLDGFADKKVRKLLESIDHTKTCSLENFIYALGIQHVGRQTAQLLADRFESLENIRSAAFEELENIDEIGPVIAESIVSYFGDEFFTAELDSMLASGVNPVFSRKSSELSGAKFVFTGSLQSMTRPAASKMLEELGAAAVSSVSSETDFIVVGEKPGSKLAKARNIGIKELTEKEFIELIGEKND